MCNNRDYKQEDWQNIIDEIDKALLDIDLSENAFQWVQNDKNLVDVAITRKQVATEYLNFLLQKAKIMGVKLNKEQLAAKILKNKSKL